jgi:hypothetical protein
MKVKCVRVHGGYEEENVFPPCGGVRFRVEAVLAVACEEVGFGAGLEAGGGISVITAESKITR